MTMPKSLPARPSQESLRKQARKRVRDVAAGNADVITRARAQLPSAELPLSLRHAHLILAREYGFPSWQELVAEVQSRLGQGLEWAVSQARRIIHDNDIERLKQLLTEHPALLSWRGEESDGGDPERERQFTRAACAEILIDAGAVVLPSVCDGLAESRTKRLLELFERKGLLPRTLKFRVALGDLDAVRACLDAGDNNPASVDEAFKCACNFEFENIASVLLERLIALDAELGRRIDDGPGRSAFIRYLIKERALLAFIRAMPQGPWQAFLMHQVVRAIHDGDLTIFVLGLQREPWLLGDSCLGFQVGLIERATLQDRGTFIGALSRSRSGAAAASATSAVASNRICVHLRQNASASGANPRLAAAGGFAARRRYGGSRSSEAVVRRVGQAHARRPLESFPVQQRRHSKESSAGRAIRSAGSRHGARLVGPPPSFRSGRLPSRAWRRHQHTMELARAGEHPARARLPR